MLLPESTLVYRIMRLRYADGKPISIERSYIRCEVAEGLTSEDVHNKSIYTSLRNKFGIKINNSNQKVTVVYANELESELLKISRYKPLMRFEGLVYDKRNILVEYFDSIFLMDKVTFLVDERDRRGDAAMTKRFNVGL